MNEHPSTVRPPQVIPCGAGRIDASATSSSPVSVIIVSWISALFLLSSAHATDFQGSVWTRVEDEAPFRYIVLRDGDARILLPKMEGYSMDSSPAELKLRHGQVDITLSALSEASLTAVRKKDTLFLRAASKPDSEVSGNSRLVSESQAEFAERGWPSQSFQYTCSGYGLATNIWIAYVVTPTRALCVRVSADPASFARAKADAIETIKRMRQIDKAAFDRQFFRDE